MKLGSISTLSTFRSMQFDTSRTQNLLVKVQQEAVSGRVADAGLALGDQSSRLMNLRNDIAKLERMNDTNSLTKAKLDLSQQGLSQLTLLANNLLSTASLDPGSTNTQEVLKKLASDTLSQTTDALNTQLNGTYVFAGVNADQKPISDYVGGAGQAAFDASFAGHFGFAKTDPGVASISAPQMEDFLDNVISPQFNGAAWNATISSASDDLSLVRIGNEVAVEPSVSANEDPMRSLMASSIIAFEMSRIPLNADANGVVSNFIIERAGSASSGFTDLQGRLGLVQENVQVQSEANAGQVSTLQELLNDSVSVDQYEAATRLTSLITQLEASYATTARLQQLSLLRYL